MVLFVGFCHLNRFCIFKSTGELTSWMNDSNMLPLSEDLGMRTRTERRVGGSHIPEISYAYVT